MVTRPKPMYSILFLLLLQRHVISFMCSEVLFVELQQNTFAHSCSFMHLMESLQGHRLHIASIHQVRARRKSAEAANVRQRAPIHLSTLHIIRLDNHNPITSSSWKANVSMISHAGWDMDCTRSKVTATNN